VGTYAISEINGLSLIHEAFGREDSPLEQVAFHFSRKWLRRGLSSEELGHVSPESCCTILLDLVQSERLPVAGVDDSDVERFHPLEPHLQCLSVVDKRGDQWAGPVLEEVSAEERLLIGQNCGG